MFDRLSSPPYLATLIATHMHSIFTAERGDKSDFSPIKGLRINMEVGQDGCYYTGEPRRCVGNSYGMAKAYMEAVLTWPTVTVTEDV